MTKTQAIQLYRLNKVRKWRYSSTHFTWGSIRLDWYLIQVSNGAAVAIWRLKTPTK